MEIIARLANLPGALPGACAQGLIWGIMAIGVYLTYRILDVADLTVDGSFGIGGAVCVMCLLSGMNVWAALAVAVLAGLLTGLVTGLLHTFMGIPAILAGILTQLALYSINLKSSNCPGKRMRLNTAKFKSAAFNTSSMEMSMATRLRRVQKP